MTRAACRYTARPHPAGEMTCVLVANPGTAEEARFPFCDHVEIGRDDGRPDAPGTILIRSPEVSRRHCIVSRRPDGRCFVRDVSLNGTRINGRRLVPNVDVEMQAGQTIAVAVDFDFVLEMPMDWSVAEAASNDTAERTCHAASMVVATLLVGDMRHFTMLLRVVPPNILQPSINRVFSRLADAVGQLEGTVKEFQGDALVAFWEGTAHGTHVADAACHAALELDRTARQLAADRSVWDVAGHALEMDWALATGPVMIRAFGGDQPAGLSVMGESIVRAFRLEKFASPATGPILACEVTKQMADARFEFRDLGQMLATGFDRPDRVFALVRERSEETAKARAR